LPQTLVDSRAERGSGRQVDLTLDSEDDMTVAVHRVDAESVASGVHDL
jgi:hypothetical protein